MIRNWFFKIVRDAVDYYGQCLKGSIQRAEGRIAELECQAKGNNDGINQILELLSVHLDKEAIEKTIVDWRDALDGVSDYELTKANLASQIARNEVISKELQEAYASE